MELNPEIIFSIITGIVAMVTGVTGSILTYKISMTKIRAEILEKEEEKQNDDRLKEVAFELNNVNKNDLKSHDAHLADQISKTMKTMLQNLQMQIDMKDDAIEEERERSLRAEQDNAKRIREMEESFNRRITALEQKLSEALEKLQDRERGIDILTAQLEAKNEKPSYKRKSTSELKVGG